jgi:mannose-1-phosphate guanylyltransferase
MREPRKVSLKVAKAFLLAAGLGTRLRPLTERVPKCLVPIGGRPLLSIWLEVCERLGLREVLINTHHLADQVQSWVRSLQSPVRIRLFHEPVLRGSGGTLADNRDFIRSGEDFYIFYADNLVAVDLTPLERFHRTHDGALTLGLFRAPEPERCGIVALDAAGRVENFEEKPQKPRSNLANAGIYLARSELFDYLPKDRFLDLGHDVLPGLAQAGKVWGTVLPGYIRDIGTLESYWRAQQEWPSAKRAAP